MSRRRSLRTATLVAVLVWSAALTTVGVTDLADASGSASGSTSSTKSTATTVTSTAASAKTGSAALAKNAGTLGAAGVASAAAAPAPTRHVVAAGETLTAIASKYGTTIDAVVKANNVRDPNSVVIGTVLVIPVDPAPASSASAAAATSSSSIMHDIVVVVKPGDSVAAFASRYGITTSAIAKANHLTNAGLIIPGQSLVLPGVQLALPNLTAAQLALLPAPLLRHPERLALWSVFDKWAKSYQVPVSLLRAITWQESGWQPNVVSATGAIGIGQLMPSTTTFINSELLAGASLDPKIAEQNIQLTARFLRFLLDQNGNKQNRVIACYYQGCRSIDMRGQFDDTKQYVASVLLLLNTFRAAEPKKG